MAIQQQRTWWQEMGAISRGMMFIEGTIATPASLQQSERLHASQAAGAAGQAAAGKAQTSRAHVPQHAPRPRRATAGTGARLRSQTSSTRLKNQSVSTRLQNRVFSLGRKLRWLLEELVLLGGRPMTARHNDDIDEPFHPLHRKTAHSRRPLASTSHKPDPLHQSASC